MRVRILGKHWNLRLGVPNLANGGDCDPPSTPRKEIRISSGLEPAYELEVLIHECLHASNWTADEDDWIAPVAADVAAILWKLGYRKGA